MQKKDFEYKLHRYCGEGGDVVIKDFVNIIGQNAFQDCTRITSISIPFSVTKIEDKAFNGCTGITSIVIPDSVTSIGEGAFFGCEGLKSVKIGSGVNNIPDRIFTGCTNLISITIGSEVTSIGACAFDGCKSLTSVTIPSGVTSLQSSSFCGCSGLTTIIVDSNNPVYYSENNCVMERKTKTLLFGCKTSVIPADTISIGDYSFFSCKDLTSILIPESVKKIGVGAFDCCDRLKYVTYEGSVRQWKRIEKRGWTGGTLGESKIRYIICTDGKVLG